MNNLDGLIQTPKESLADLKAVESMLDFTVINANDKEAMKRLFPSQSDLLKKLEDNGFTPEKVREMCKKEKSVAEKLFRYGLEFESLKKAGVTPSSVVGMKYQYYFEGYLHNSRKFEGEVSFYDLIDEFGFTVEELIKDGISKKNIPREYLAEAGYSPKKRKKK